MKHIAPLTASTGVGRVDIIKSILSICDRQNVVVVFEGKLQYGVRKLIERDLAQGSGTDMKASRLSSSVLLQLHRSQGYNFTPVKLQMLSISVYASLPFFCYHVLSLLATCVWGAPVPMMIALQWLEFNFAHGRVWANIDAFLAFEFLVTNLLIRFAA